LLEQVQTPNESVKLSELQLVQVEELVHVLQPEAHLRQEVPEA
jgi:hypothetical protein